jgi:hypothetical protein
MTAGYSGSSGISWHRTPAVSGPPTTSYQRLLRKLVDEKTCPRLHRIASAHEIGNNVSGFDDHEEFASGLDRILAGVAALIAHPKSRRH